jgi:type IV pilus assembly protein PilE
MIGHRTPRRSGFAGFSLIELMVVVLIAGILASIALPAYQSQIRKSRRTEAKTALLDLAGREERYFSTNNAYSAVTTDLGFTGTFPQTVGDGYYQVSAPTVTVGTATAVATFSISAVPIGNQTKDTKCASFTVTSAGLQTSLDSGGADSSSTCWK